MTEKRKFKEVTETKDGSVPREHEAKKAKLMDWEISPSSIALQTINPIRNVVDNIKVPEAPPDKPLIRLNLGDPTVFGNLDTPDVVVSAVREALISKKWNGYGLSIGHLEARKAIAKKYSKDLDTPLTEKDVVITSGGSGAIVIAIQALANPGDNILIPKPGFPLYATAAGHSGINYKYYNLLPDRSWEVDLKQMRTLVDSKTKAIVLNNPSNPCGANYSKQHLQDILVFAEEHKLPIISDEIYADLVFPGQKFHALAKLSKEVPILECGGLAKQFSLPGWRVGWILVHDRHNRFKEIYGALLSLSQLIIGACTLVQAAIPRILGELKQDHYDGLMTTLCHNAMYLVDRLKRIPGLHVVTPQGAMYVMVRLKADQFKDIANDQEFTQKLLDEEFVYVLPGSCFQAPNFVRIVFCAPEQVLRDACDRIEQFCARHRKSVESSG